MTDFRHIDAIRSPSVTKFRHRGPNSVTVEFLISNFLYDKIFSWNAYFVFFFQKRMCSFLQKCNFDQKVIGTDLKTMSESRHHTVLIVRVLSFTGHATNVTTYEISVRPTVFCLFVCKKLLINTSMCARMYSHLFAQDITSVQGRVLKELSARNFHENSKCLYSMGIIYHQFQISLQLDQ